MDDAIYNLTYSDLTHKVDVDPKLEYDKLKVLNCYAQVFDDNIFECRIYPNYYAESIRWRFDNGWGGVVSYSINDALSGSRKDFAVLWFPEYEHDDPALYYGGGIINMYNPVLQKIQSKFNIGDLINYLTAIKNITLEYPQKSIAF